MIFHIRRFARHCNPILGVYFCKQSLIFPLHILKALTAPYSIAVRYRFSIHINLVFFIKWKAAPGYHLDTQGEYLPISNDLKLLLMVVHNSIEFFFIFDQPFKGFRQFNGEWLWNNQKRTRIHTLICPKRGGTKRSFSSSDSIVNRTVAHKSSPAVR